MRQSRLEPVRLPGERVDVRGVAVQDDVHADLTAVLHDLVHALQRGQADQVRVDAPPHSVDDGVVAQHLVREWDAEGVEAQRLRLWTDTDTDTDGLISGMKGRDALVREVA